MYNTLNKLNSNGIVKDIKSNNSYLVFVNDRIKHVSSDHMTLISNNNMKDKVVIDTNLNDDLNNMDEDLDMSDNMSVDYDSDNELYSQTSNDVNNNNVHRRHYRTEAQKLQNYLSNFVHPGSRLRSSN